MLKYISLLYNCSCSRESIHLLTIKLRVFSLSARIFSWSFVLCLIKQGQINTRNVSFCFFSEIILASSKNWRRKFPSPELAYKRKNKVSFLLNWLLPTKLKNIAVKSFAECCVSPDQSRRSDDKKVKEPTKWLFSTL